MRVPAWGCKGWSSLEGEGIWNHTFRFQRDHDGGPPQLQALKELESARQSPLPKESSIWKPAPGPLAHFLCSHKNPPTELSSHYESYPLILYVLSITYLLCVLNIWHSSWHRMLPHEWGTRKGKLGAGNVGNACKWVGSFQEAWFPQTARAVSQGRAVQQERSNFPNSWDTGHVTKTGCVSQHMTGSQLPQLPGVESRS